MAEGESLDPSMRRLLGEYLAGDGGEWGGARAELHRTRVNVRELGEAFAQHVQDDERRHRRLETLHEETNRRLDTLELGEEVTGVQNVADLRDKYRETRVELAKAKDAEAERRKALANWGLGIAASFVVSMVTWFVTKVVH